MHFCSLVFAKLFVYTFFLFVYHISLFDSSSISKPKVIMLETHATSISFDEGDKQTNPLKFYMLK